jgi:hypothetical protein
LVRPKVCLEEERTSIISTAQPTPTPSLIVDDGHPSHALGEPALHTGAEFTPVSSTPDSLLVWTGYLGSVLETGELYRYADVLAMMKRIWQQSLQAA